MTTPARRQYLRIKGEHQDAILLFRMGDFYETFDNDARVISRELEIALTSREFGAGSKVPLAGIPYHALDSYLARLIKQGYKVAICEQTSESVRGRGIVDREVVRVVTPGTVVEDALLEGKANNYLAAAFVDGDSAGFAYADITTSEFATTQFPIEQLPVELARLSPAELLLPGESGGDPGADDDEDDDADRYPKPDYVPDDTAVTPLDSESFDLEWSTESLMRHFDVASLEAFGCDRLPLAVRAAGAILDYLRATQKAGVSQITTLRAYSTERHMALDPQTRRNLELFEGGRWGDTSASLLSVLDKTKTSMGGRTLRAWVGHPLLDLDELRQRQDAVGWFHRSALRRDRVIALLGSVSDVQRLLNRTRTFTATPRDLVSLASSLESAPYLKEILSEDDDADAVSFVADGISDTSEVVALIRSAILDDPPVSAGDGKVIRPGFSTEMDAIRNSATEAQQYIARLESRERERTGIKSLKVGYNRVFGYYIEISNPNLKLAPDDYVRRQTLVGGERFITPEMKEYESRVLSAQDRMADLETQLFRNVCAQVVEHSGAISETAQAIALVDVFCALGDVASRNGYVKPELSDSDAIEIRQGRHPVVERVLEAGDFVPNDTELSCSDAQLAIITGPNMAGKSTYIRQVAILVSDGADRQLRAGGVGVHRACGSHLQPRRTSGRPRARTIYVHGGDGRNRVHPEPRHAALADNPGRDRARHKHVRRACHSPRRRRVHTQPPAPGLQDAVRHALPRTDAVGRPPAARPQLQRRRIRGRGQHSLSAPHSAGRGGPQLRHPRSAARRYAVHRSQPRLGRAGRPGNRTTPRRRRATDAGEERCARAAARATRPDAHDLPGLGSPARDRRILHHPHRGNQQAVRASRAG